MINTAPTQYTQISDLPKIFRNLNFRKALVILGSKTYEANIEKLQSNLKFHHIIFNDFEKNPSLSSLANSLKIFLEENCDVIVAIGGGTAIDLAKLTSIFSSNKGEIMDYITGISSFSERGCKVVAIPTTSGSGSESTHFAVLYKGIKKYSIASNFMLPEYIILDPTLTHSMPKRLAAVSGMDALCQGIESFWSNKSNSLSESYSIKAIELCFNHLEKSVNYSKKESREKMQIAANYSGMAINIAKTTASHAISYPLSMMFGIDHGHAVALTLPQLINLNFNTSEDNINYNNNLNLFNDKMNKFLTHFNLSDYNLLSERIIHIMKSIDLETKFTDLNINLTKNKISKILENVNVQRLANNPRFLSNEEISFLLEKIS